MCPVTWMKIAHPVHKPKKFSVFWVVFRDGLYLGKGKIYPDHLTTTDAISKGNAVVIMIPVVKLKMLHIRGRCRFYHEGDSLILRYKLQESLPRESPTNRGNYKIQLNIAWCRSLSCSVNFLVHIKNQELNLASHHAQ